MGRVEVVVKEGYLMTMELNGNFLFYFREMSFYSL